MTPTLKYFAYGSNLHPIRLRERAPSARLLGVASLAGWSLRFHKRGLDGSGKCNVVPATPDGGVVHGALYELSPGEKAGLDRVEGLGRGYEERWLEFPARGPAFLYVAAAGHVDEALRPFTWYKALVLAGARFHGLPRTYIQAIEAVAAVIDPQADRRERHLRLLGRFRGTPSPAPQR